MLFSITTVNRSWTVQIEPCVRTYKMFTFHFSKWAELSGSPRAHLHVVGILRLMFLTQTNRVCPLLFILFLCLFVSLWPFRLISFHKFSRQLSAFSLCSSGLMSALLVLSAIYLFIKVSFSPDIILCGWLGLAVIAFSLCARILGECLTIHTPFALF